MFIYAVVVCLTLFVGWLYVWERLIETASLGEPLRQTLLGFFVIAYGLQAVRWLFFRVKGDLSWLVGPAYFSVGLLSLLFLATLTKDLFYQLWWLGFPEHFDRHQAWVHAWTCYTLFFGSLAASLWGAQTVYEGPKVETVAVRPLQRSLPPASRPFRVVQISDLHVGPLIRKPYVEQVVSLCNSLRPDIVVFTGDIGDGRPEHLENDLQPLKALHAPQGVYYVTGNHEYYWNVDGWIHVAKGVGMDVLFNSGRALAHEGRTLWLGGVPDRHAKHLRADHPHDVQAALAGSPDDAYKILLAHQPRSVIEGEEAGFDLVLSGHTHAGQYFPFTLVVDWFNPYSKGLHQHGKAHIYVNQGTGFWGPPLRLGTRSEITLLEIEV